MENQMQIFNNEQFGEIRTILIKNEPWFVAVDVCRALEIGNSSQAISRLDEDEKMITLISNEGNKRGNPNMMAVNEPGLYALILSSRKPEAKAFRRWITHEVIPAIRKTGGYIAGEENMTDDELVAKALIITAEKLKQREARIAALSAQIEEDRPYTHFGKSISASDAAILLGDFAKVAANSGINIGRNRLFKWLRDNKYLMPDNKPYQRYVDQGVFAVKESKVFTGFEETIRTTTLVTGKGQKYLMERLEAGA